MPNRTAIISGGGMAGLATAIALCRAGWSVTVLEQAQKPRELGAGLWISVNGARVLSSFGLTEHLDAIDLPPVDRVVRLWNTAQELSIYHPGGKHNADHRLYMVLRYELHRILLEAARSNHHCTIKFAQKVVATQDNDTSVQVTTSSGETYSADLLVGADGVHSNVRSTTFGYLEPQYTDALAWRGLVPISQISEEARTPIASTWVGPTAHITCYPVQSNGERFFSFSGQVSTSRWLLDSWSQKGSVDECLQDFSGWHPQILEMLQGSDILYKWGIFIIKGLTRYNSHRVVLVGDAAHSTTPYLGQGVNMAFEDALVLANVLKKIDDVPHALERFNALRFDRTQQIRDASSAMLDTFHSEQLYGDKTAFPYVTEQWSSQAVKRRYDWIVSYDARTEH